MLYVNTLVKLIICCSSIIAVSGQQEQPPSYIYATVPDCNTTLYAGRISAVDDQGQQMTNFSLSSSSGECTIPTTSNLTLQLASTSSQFSQLSMKFNFAPSSDAARYSNTSWWWIVDELTITCTGTHAVCMAGVPIKANITWASAPVNSGFKCTKTPSILVVVTVDPNAPDSQATGTSNSFRLQLSSFQLQPFGSINGNFSSSVHDCVGYFTVPILSTLIVSLLMIGLLTYGISMLSSINSYDFDQLDERVKSVKLVADR